MFPLISPEEVAQLTSRNVVTIRKRLRQFRLAGWMKTAEEPHDHISYFEEIKCMSCGSPNLIERVSGRTRPQPGLHYLTPKGERYGTEHGYFDRVAAAWTDKSALIVPHDRGINLIHLAFHNGFGPRVSDWRQQRDEVKESATVDGERVNFYADARFTIGKDTMWLEYCLAHPSSKRGETDIMTKVRRYNELFKAHRKANGTDPGKVLFIFKEKSHIKHFLDTVSEHFPYLWIHVTDMESVKHDPTGKIWWTPKDFDTRTHGLIEQAA